MSQVATEQVLDALARTSRALPRPHLSRAPYPRIFPHLETVGAADTRQAAGISEGTRPILLHFALAAADTVISADKNIIVGCYLHRTRGVTSDEGFVVLQPYAPQLGSFRTGGGARQTRWACAHRHHAPYCERENAHSLAPCRDCSQASSPCCICVAVRRGNEREAAENCGKTTQQDATHNGKPRRSTCLQSPPENPLCARDRRLIVRFGWEAAA